MAYMFLIGLGIGLCLILAAASIFCVTAFKRITMRDLESLAKTDGHATRLWRSLVMQQDRVVSTFFVAYVFFIIMLTTYMAYFWLGNFSGWAVFAHIICVWLFLLLGTYYLPKSYALRQDSDFILKILVPIHILYMVFSLPARLVALVGTGVTSLIKNHFYNMNHLISAEHEMNFIVRYRGIMAAQDPEGLKEAKEQRRMTRALEEYLDKKVDAAMVDIADIPMVDGEQPMDELLDKILNSNAPRMLVFQETQDQLIGVLHVDLFMKSVALAEGDLNAVDLLSAISELLYIPENRTISSQIKQFRQHKQRFALVQDAQGATIGGISHDDLLQQIGLLLARDEDNADQE